MQSKLIPCFIIALVGHIPVLNSIEAQENEIKVQKVPSYEHRSIRIVSYLDEAQNASLYRQMDNVAFLAKVTQLTGPYDSRGEARRAKTGARCMYPNIEPADCQLTLAVLHIRSDVYEKVENELNSYLATVINPEFKKRMDDNLFSLTYKDVQFMGNFLAITFHQSIVLEQLKTWIENKVSTLLPYGWEIKHRASDARAWKVFLDADKNPIAEICISFVPYISFAKFSDEVEIRNCALIEPVYSGPQFSSAYLSNPFITKVTPWKKGISLSPS